MTETLCQAKIREFEQEQGGKEHLKRQDRDKDATGAVEEPFRDNTGRKRSTWNIRSNIDREKDTKGGD